MRDLFLGLGSNLGDKRANLEHAIDAINKRVGSVVFVSSFVCSEPWGFQSANTFVNCAVKVRTDLDLPTTLRLLQDIERQLGRTAKSVDGTYADRLIDIDILLDGDTVCRQPDLVVPHPLMHLRRFVLAPLAEIAPGMMHPTLRRTMAQLLSDFPIE